MAFKDFLQSVGPALGETAVSGLASGFSGALSSLVQRGMGVPINQQALPSYVHSMANRAIASSGQEVQLSGQRSIANERELDRRLQLQLNRETIAAQDRRAQVEAGLRIYETSMRNRMMRQQLENMRQEYEGRNRANTTGLPRRLNDMIFGRDRTLWDYIYKYMDDRPPTKSGGGGW